MCTLSFVPLGNGFALAMNRDEQKTRVQANPPSLHFAGDLQALYPSEPGGGTWFGVNSRGLVLALVNWYEKTPAPHEAGVKGGSRGEIIPRLLRYASIGEANLELNEPAFSANRLPFRLTGFQNDRHSIHSGTVCEWRWDGTKLEKIDHPWQRKHWFSSGHDERGANRTRAKVAAEVQIGPEETPSHALAKLRKLHQSHQPERGPYSICMHRADAHTVSYVDLLITDNKAAMNYVARAPCQSGTEQVSIGELEIPGP